MNVFKYILIAWFVLQILVVVGNVGKKRTPITPATAVTVLVTNAIIGSLVVMS